MAQHIATIQEIRANSEMTYCLRAKNFHVKFSNVADNVIYN